MAFRRIALALLSGAAALAIGGCERLCGPSSIGVFCPETSANPLNDPPVVHGAITIRPLEVCRLVTVGRRVVFSLPPAVDPDGDELLYEWDLDGDGDFEAGGREPSRIYTTPGVVDVRVRVSDFPAHLGAPGVVERSLRVTVVDPARNRPPEAAFTATAPVVAGSGVAFDAGATTDPDIHDHDAFAYGWDFGDGIFRPQQNVVAQGLRTVVHTYQFPGD
jgi:hypothetical protein